MQNDGLAKVLVLHSILFYSFLLFGLEIPYISEVFE